MSDTDTPLVLSPVPTQLRSISIELQQQQMQHLQQQASEDSSVSNSIASHAVQPVNIASTTAHSSGLASILFASFDTTLGPVIKCQVPCSALSSASFDECSNYVIASSKSFAHKLVSVQSRDFILLSLPLVIVDSRYHRNSLMFNISFVFGRHSTRHANEALQSGVEEVGQLHRDSRDRVRLPHKVAGTVPAAAAAAAGRDAPLSPPRSIRWHP